MPQPGKLADALKAGGYAAVKLSRAASAGASNVPVPAVPPFHRVYVSSSQRENSTVNQARAGLHSPAFHELVSMSHRLPGADGGKSGLGYWSDGAEESRVVHVVDPALAEKVGAALAKTHRQKSFAYFVTDPSGKDTVHVLTVPGADSDRIADVLMAHGIEHKTILPDANRGQTEVHIIDLGTGSTASVAGAARELGAKHDQHLGRADFPGAETREEAQRVYDKILTP